MRHAGKAVAAVTFTAVLLTAVAAAVCALLFAGEAPAPSPAVPVYDLDIVYDGDRSVTLREDIYFVSDGNETSEDIALHLYANAFSEGNPSPPYASGEEETFFFGEPSFGDIRISSAKINGKTVDPVISEDGQLLTLPVSLDPGESADIELVCSLTLPRCRGRMGVKSRSIDLAGFYPVLCVRENGRWRTDGYTPFGDPFYSEISSFYVTLTAPADLAVACSGKALSRSVRDGFAVTTIAAERVRDFALSLSRDFRLSRASVRTGGRTVEINYHSLSDPVPESTLAAITYAVEEFSRAFGDYPYDTFTVAQTELVSGGMEYGSFAVISDAASGEALADIAVHETAHQWWFGVVGSDQLNSPWLDEGLAEFSVGYLRLLRGDEEGYRAFVREAESAYLAYRRLPAALGFDPALQRPLSSFLTSGEYAAVAYAKGVLLMDALLSLAGEERFSDALARYYSSCAFDIASPSDLIAAFKEAGFDAEGVIASFSRGTDVIA